MIMSNQFQDRIDVKGMAAEYHVNNTLHLELGAARYTVNSSQQDYILFDGILLPAPKTKRDQPFTEVDHILISTKGVFAIETKSISGKVYGEKASHKWHSAQASTFKKDGLYDREFTNPFRQNSFHISAINELLKKAGIQTWATNIVALVDADESGWEEGHWGSEQRIPGLFLSAKEIVQHLNTLPDILSKSQVSEVASVLYPYYLKTEANMAEFRSHHA
jgi:hypothetical protein